MTKRTGKVKRKTKETEIETKVVIDGKGESQINTGIRFLDHMLELFAHHGLFDITVNARRADLDIDIHHTNEDVGITLGMAFKKALGNMKGINRFGFYVPMEEALVSAVVDISGRPLLCFNVKKRLKYIATKDYSLNDVKEFLRAFCRACGINAHIDIIRGDDPHHIIEAIFKAFARAMDGATRIDSRRKTIPSTKGKI